MLNLKDLVLKFSTAVLVGIPIAIIINGDKCLLLYNIIQRHGMILRSSEICTSTSTLYPDRVVPVLNLVLLKYLVFDPKRYKFRSKFRSY